MIAFPFVLATGNVDKAREIQEVLSEVLGCPLAAWALEPGGELAGFVVDRPDRVGTTVGGLRPLDHAPDVEETGATLEDNARIKARAWCDALGLPAIADDTGLEVDALGGAPGVHSARYAGEGATYARNVEKLLDSLRDVDAGERRARFTTIAIARWPDGHEVLARGEVEGTITLAPRGCGGFGYDPVFVPADGGGRTFAEMTADEKHGCSHRGRAFRALAAALAEDDRESRP